MASRDQFRAGNLRQWTEALGAVAAPVPAASMTWRGLGPIRDALRPFLGDNRNHAMLPTGGGLDIEGVADAAEPGCLSLALSDARLDVAKPFALTLEVFPATPLESFLLLELAELAPTPILRGEPGVSEEVFQYLPGCYVSRSVWDQGYLEYDQDGREVPLPPEGQVGTRWLSGKLLIVAKSSLWNAVPGTYDGRHNRMDAAGIRRAIQRVLDQRKGDDGAA